MSENSYLIETMTAALARLALEEGVATDIQSALDFVYNSPLYDKITDPASGLLYQHPGYVYQYLNS